MIERQKKNKTKECEIFLKLNAMTMTMKNCCIYNSFWLLQNIFSEIMQKYNFEYFNIISRWNWNSSSFTVYYKICAVTIRLWIQIFQLIKTHLMLVYSLPHRTPFVITNFIPKTLSLEYCESSSWIMAWWTNIYLLIKKQLRIFNIYEMPIIDMKLDGMIRSNSMYV